MRSVAVARARSCKFELQQHAPPFYPRLHAPRKNSRVFPAEMQLRNPRMGFLFSHDHFLVVAILSHDPFQRELDPFQRELVGTVSGGFSTASAPRRQDPRPS